MLIEQFFLLLLLLYLFDNLTSEEEFYTRLNWLRGQDIISPEEYQDYKNSFDLLRLLK